MTAANLKYCKHCAYYLIPHGPPERDRKSSFWSVEGGRVYMSCPACMALSEIPNVIQDDGHVTSCVICPECGGHLFVRLEDWDEKELESRPGDLWETRCPECQKIGHLVSYHTGDVIRSSSPALSPGRLVICYCCQRKFLAQKLMRKKRGKK